MAEIQRLARRERLTVGEWVRRTLREARAGKIVQSRVLMAARDAVHIAVMERHGIRSIFSFDGDFDRWPGLQRIHRV
jgi:predicted nucleic acid-binding protein